MLSPLGGILGAKNYYRLIEADDATGDIRQSRDMVVIDTSQWHHWIDLAVTDRFQDSASTRKPRLG